MVKQNPIRSYMASELKIIIRNKALPLFVYLVFVDVDFNGLNNDGFSQGIWINCYWFNVSILNRHLMNIVYIYLQYMNMLVQAQSNQDNNNYGCFDADVQRK